MNDVLIEPDEEDGTHAAWRADTDRGIFVVATIDDETIRLTSSSHPAAKFSPDEAEHVAALLTAAADWSRRHAV